MAVRKIGFQAAVGLLGTVNIAENHFVDTNKMVDVERITENPPFTATYEKFFKPHAWLTERGLLPATLERYGVGFYQNDTRRSAYNGSVMLRISRYSDGEIVGYLSRNIGEVTPEKPKYRFPANLQKSLEVFGAWQLKGSGGHQHRMIYVVESPFAVMMFHQLDLPAVSPFGWSISPQQIEILKQLAKGIVFLPDRDKRKEAAQFAGLISESCWVKMPGFEMEDPESLSLEQIKALA